MFTQKNVRTAIKYALGLFAIWIAAMMIAKLYEAQTQFTCDNGGLAVIAQRDDTLWKVAERYCTGDIRAAVDEMVGIRGVDLMPGAIIHLP
jgi:hypothetical protein